LTFAYRPKEYPLNQSISAQIAGVFTLFLAGCGGEYAAQNKQITNDLFKNDFPDYTFLETAGGTNAVGTMRAIPCNRPFQECWIVADPDRWFAENVSADEGKELLSRIVKRGKFGTLQLSRNIQTGVSAATELPNISNVLSLEAKIDLARAARVDLAATDVSQVELDALEMNRALENRKFQPAVAGILRSGKYRIVQGDIRYGGYKLVVDASSDVNLAAKLTAQEQAAAVIGKGAGFQLSVHHTSENHFEIVNNDPVVVAYLVSDAIPQTRNFAQARQTPAALKTVMPGRNDRSALEELFARPKRQ